MDKTKIDILATGNLLVGKGIRSIETVTMELMKEAKKEVRIATFSLGPGSKDIIKIIDDTLSRGVTIFLVINHMEEQPKNIVSELNKLKKQYPHFKLFDFNQEGERLHAKVMVFDGKKAIIGSANLTWRAMVKNHEMGVLIEGDTVQSILRAVTNLMG